MNRLGKTERAQGMPSIFDPLVDIIHSRTLDSWKDRNEKALAALFGARYAKRAEKSVALRAPDMKGSDTGVPYAAYIHPSNAGAGAYGGMSFVMFPVEGEPCLVAMVIGTQGLAPDESILGRPGHARKMQAVTAWLNHRYGGGNQLAWAKQDPTRIDIDVPDSLQRAWSAYERVFKRYGRVLYALYKPTEDRSEDSPENPRPQQHHRVLQGRLFVRLIRVLLTDLSLPLAGRSYRHRHQQGLFD